MKNFNFRKGFHLPLISFSIKMPDDVYDAFDSFERKMDNAIGGFDILDESPAAAAAVLVNVKSGRFPPRFEVDDSGPFGNPFEPNRCPGFPPPVFDQCTGPPPPCFW